jgi:hypothetical protein
MRLQKVRSKTILKQFLVAILKVTDENIMIRGTGPRIRIRINTKMSLIRNTDAQDEENGEKVEKDNIKYLIAVYRCTTNRYRRKISHTFCL